MAALKSFETTCPKCGKTAFAVSHPGPIHCPECGETGLHVFVCERIKKGPALWEQGGGYTNTGEAQVIAGSRGEKLKPIYVKTRGHRANGQHALFIVQLGYHVIRVGYWNKQDPPYSITVYQIQNIIEFMENPDKPEDKKLLALAHAVSSSDFLQPAIDAAIAKARCYHCREPHYALLGDQQ
jgi:ribosomal protein S27AE